MFRFVLVTLLVIPAVWAGKPKSTGPFKSDGQNVEITATLILDREEIKQAGRKLFGFHSEFRFVAEHSGANDCRRRITGHHFIHTGNCKFVYAANFPRRGAPGEQFTCETTEMERHFRSRWEPG